MQYVDQLPLPVPSRTDPANFSVRGDNFLGALPDYSTQLNALATEVNAANVAAESSKNLAKTSEINAQASAFAAAGSANSAASNSGAVLWVSGTTYAIGDLRYSPANGRTYRRRTVGAGTTDPSLDTTNWYPVLLEVSTLYPNIRPSLNLDFINSKQLDPRITFTRSTTAKYFDGKTYHKAEENLLTYSEQLGNAAWTKVATTVTSDTTISPVGTSSADSLFNTAVTSSHHTYNFFNCTTGLVYVASVYAKYNNRQFLQLAFSTTGFNSTHYANFDVQNGVLGTIGAGATATIESVGNGWYRCQITCTAVSSSTASAIKIGMANSSSMVFDGSYLGAVSDTVYLWGAQVEQRSSLGPYVGTTTQPITNYQMTLVNAAVNQPRFDHDPITGERKGLFIEDATTNLLTYSEDFGNAIWTKAAVTVSGDFTYAPDGTKSADKLIETATTAGHVISTTSGITVSGSKKYSYSVYAKAKEKQHLQLIVTGVGLGVNDYANFDLQNGLIGDIGVGIDAVITPVGNGWYRCSISFIPVSGTIATLYMWLINASNSARAPSTAGNGYDGLFIWGAQFEDASASPSSYVATTSTTVTRSYDLAQLTGNNFSSWYNQQEGSILAEVKMDQKPLSGYFNNRLLTLESGSSSNSIYSMFDSAGILRSDVVFNGNIAASLTSGSWSVGEIYKSTIAFASDNFAGCFNSGTVSTDNSGVLPKNLTTCYIGSGTAFLRGYIRKFQYYPKRLSNTELQALSAL